MWQFNTAILEDVDVADRRRPLAIGEAVCVRAGTSDPDFPGRMLDGWMGVVVDVDHALTPTRYLVQWDQHTVDGMPLDYNTQCEMEDFVLDQMWLMEDDLDALPL